jgi:hypothetical protein
MADAYYGVGAPPGTRRQRSPRASGGLEKHTNK